MRHAPSWRWGLALAAVALAAGTAGADRVVLKDGTVVEGDAVVESAANRITLSFRKGGMLQKRAIPFADAIAVERTDGTLAWVDVPDSVPLACHALWDVSLRDRVLDLAAQAVTAGDANLATRLLAEAEHKGAPKAKVEGVRRQIAKTAAEKPALVQADVDRIVAAEKGLPLEEAAWCWTRYVPLLKDADAARQIAWARDVLSMDPKHAAATERLAGLMPKDLAGKMALADWLGWVDALGGSVVLRLPPGPKEPEQGMDSVTRELGRAAATWRKDVVAVVGADLFIVTPPPPRKGVAQCLKAGEAVCALLEALFRSDAPRPRDREKMPLLLYASREEYLAQDAKTARQRGENPAEDVEETLALYSAQDALSRVSWVEKPGSATVEGTFPMVLAAQWLANRCPRFSPAERHASASGCWVDVAIGEVVGEGTVDVDRGRWTEAGKDARSVGFTVSLSDAELALPWKTVFEIGAKERRALSSAPHRGRNDSMASEAWAFTKQASAAGHFLFSADGGKRRKAFVDYVVDYATGKEDRLDVKAAFGASAEEIGAQVVAWGRK